MEGIFVYLCLIHVVVQQLPTQRCKTIIQLKIKIHLIGFEKKIFFFFTKNVLLDMLYLLGKITCNKSMLFDCEIDHEIDLILKN